MLNKWFGSNDIVQEIVHEDVSVKFESDNNSTKLPYRIIIEGKETGHLIVFDNDKGVWYLKMDLSVPAFVENSLNGYRRNLRLSQESLQDILAKVEYLNAQL